MMYVKTDYCERCDTTVPTKFFSRKYSICWYCVKKSRRDGYQKRKDWYRDYNKSYRENNREFVRGLWSAWYQNNKDKASAYQSKRRAYRLKATPAWLTQSHLDEIQKYYTFRSNVSGVIGKDYEVDHIVPLKGKNVCGLHVPWNLQVITKESNRSKSNNYNDWN